MPDWKTRLAVSYTDKDGNDVNVTPIDSFSPSFALSTEVLHSIEATHIGAVYSPTAITFSMTCKAIGPVVGQLTALALNSKRFKVLLQETDDGHDWAFKTIVLEDCMITSAAPTAASPTGAPSATFSGISLKGTADPKVGKAASTGRKP
jgi:hypothetical protein